MDYWFAAIPSHRIEVHEQWPADWWQAFKARWFPLRWLARWPVRYERVDVSEPVYAACCPHIDASGTDSKHIRWLQEQVSEEG